MGKLTAVAVKAALANPGTYQDGEGLLLKVDKRGGAYWLLRIQRDGKRQDIGLGSAKLLTLAEARGKAIGLRKTIKVDQRDVLVERKDEAAAKVTFRVAACQYHSENEAGWKSSVYARQWLASLENYAFPKLGNVPTGSISAADIIAVLTPIWQEIPETARQVRNRICAVLDYAHAKGWRFPGVAGKPMSDMTLLKVLRDMSEPFHVHGFRSSFTDWAANEGFADAVVEAALAHKTPDAVQAAYRRTTYLGTANQPGARVELMEVWGSYCVSHS